MSSRRRGSASSNGVKGNDHIMRGRLRLLLASSSVAALLLGGGPRSALAACTINDVGVNVATVSNSVAIDCVNVQNSTVTGSVTNTGAGTLTPVGITPPTATGITINNSKIGGSVSNAGTITAPLATGIVVNNNSSVAGGVTNSGSLSAGIFGINVFNNGTFGGGISNSGTVSVGGTGMIAAFVGTFTGGITNSGTVTAGSVGLAASGDLSFTGGITNAATGTITGANAGISVTQVSTFLGGIANAGVITSVHTGIFIDGGNTFSGGIANSGTISASNVGIQIGLKTPGGTLFGVTSFSGNVSNAGTITAKTGISIVGSTINGAIVDSGTLNATSHGILIDNASKIVSSPTAIRITGPTFTGGISNAGTIISASGEGIRLTTPPNFVSTFLGGISNSGTISAGGIGPFGDGIDAFGTSTFSGGIGNSGMITSAHTIAISVGNFSNFSGGIRNSGTLSAGGSGIVVAFVSTFSGGISNSGTVSGHTGGIFVFHLSTFSGGITNSGSVSATGIGGVVATRAGISVTTVSAFSGGISNSGTISVANGGAVVNNRDGISVTTVSTFVGGISNSGTVSVVGVPGVGINVSGVSTFSGNISNAGAITANTGIKVLSNVTFAGGGAIANSGSITGTGGTAIDASAATSAVTINQTAGAINGAIKLSTNADVLNVSGGAINGNIVGAGVSDTINFAPGAGTFTYNSAFTGINQVNINSGTVVLNGANTATKVDVNGGTLAGSGSIDPTLVTIHSGATFAPGTPGVAGTSMTIVGNLAFQSGALYLVYLGANASSANVSGNASLAGTVEASFPSAGTVSKRYTILTASGGLGGTAFSSLTNINLPSGASDSLSYDANHVYLNVTAPFSTFTGLSINQQNVANALNNFFNTNGSIPAAFFGLTPSGLTQIDGENGTGAERAAFQLTDEFLSLMLDPFVNGRAYVGGGGGPTLGFVPDTQANLPPDVALAYASILTRRRRKLTSISAGVPGVRLMAEAAVPAAVPWSARTILRQALSVLPAAWTITFRPTRSSVLRSVAPAPVGALPTHSALAAVMRFRWAPTASPGLAPLISPARSHSPTTGSRPAARH